MKKISKQLITFILFSLISLAGYSQCVAPKLASNYPELKNPTCGKDNGSITVRATGAGKVTYRINGGAYQDSGVFKNLGANTYTVDIKDASNSNCINTVSYTLKGQTAIVIDDIVVTNTSSCENDTADGKITIVTSAGIDLEYRLNDGSYQASNQFSNLAAGRYSIQIKDANGCIEKKDVTVAKGALAIQAVQVENTECGANDGSIQVEATSPSSIQYSIEKDVWVSNSKFSSLKAGNYKLTVRDAGGCVLVRNISIKPNLTFTLSATRSECASSTGTVSVNIENPDLYEYKIGNGGFQNSPQFSNLQANNYSVTVKHKTKDCQLSKTIRVGVNSQIQNVRITSKPTNCEANNGEIVVSADGNGLQYFLEDAAGQRTESADGTFSNLAEGGYKVILSDAEGCTFTRNSVVNSQSDIDNKPSIDIKKATCAKSDGEVTINVTALSGIRSYQIKGQGTATTDNAFKNLPAGEYIFLVTSNNGCQSEFKALIDEESDISLGSVNTIPPTTACAGDGRIEFSATGSNLQYSVDGINYQTDPVFTGLNAGTYIIYVKNGSGCIKKSGKIELTSSFQLKDVIIKNATCFESNGSLEIVAIGEDIVYFIDDLPGQQDGIFKNLSAGEHKLRILEKVSGCDYSTTIKIEDEAGIKIKDVKVENTTCSNDNGKIEIEPNLVGKSATATFSIDGENYQESPIFEGIKAGSYSIYAKDNTGCADTLKIDLASSENIDFKLDVKPSVCDKSDGQIKIKAKLATKQTTFQYAINGGDYQSLNQFTGLAPNDYEIKIKDDFGCIITDTVKIERACTPLFAIGFSPNGDGVNDILKMNYDLPLQVKRCAIYNVWGEKIYEAKDFVSTNESQWWNGGGALAGTYLLYVEFKDEAGNEKEYTSTVTLVR